MATKAFAVRKPDRRSDENSGTPCGCKECRAAGVEKEPQRKIPGEPGCKPIWIHGWRLKRWLEARNQLRAAFKRAVEHKEFL